MDNLLDFVCIDLLGFVKYCDLIRPIPHFYGLLLRSAIFPYFCAVIKIINVYHSFKKGLFT